ncbi:unnamed protein product [Gongylonema pulchrum]|uniref:ABC transporter n=1 Tax=Gongylonema pulchrum TaxID=637853 RepID=A0A183EDE7_9BILA|nr:unnamed protein product [Gongylonema pulchrum]
MSRIGRSSALKLKGMALKNSFRKSVIEFGWFRTALASECVYSALGVLELLRQRGTGLRHLRNEQFTGQVIPVAVVISVITASVVHARALNSLFPCDRVASFQCEPVPYSWKVDIL